MSGFRKQYDAVFKREAVELADQSEKTDRAIERELGLYQGAIRAWRKTIQAAASSPPASSEISAAHEIRRLRRELDDVRTERDILKKAMAIFTTDR